MAQADPEHTRSTLAGLAANPDELAGYGPIPAEMARELAAIPPNAAICLTVPTC